MTTTDHADEPLRVYPSRTLDDGWWSPIYGDIKAPEGWEFLPSGDPFVTRQVKKLGPHWVAVRARKGYTATLGLLAPAASMRAARRLAGETVARREAVRSRSQQRREAQEQAYRQQFTEAVLRFLDFAPRHKALAQEIAERAAEQATAVGSGRVGRTAKLSLEEKVELAARACIRHHHTRYEERIIKAGLFEPDHGDPVYRDLRARAQEEVDKFLERHRQHGRRSSRGNTEDTS